MTEDFQDVYGGPIDERLFPYYKHLESAVELFTGASEGCKHLYEGKIKEAYIALTTAKTMIIKPGAKKG
jgi:hypothetical protein